MVPIFKSVIITRARGWVAHWSGRDERQPNRRAAASPISSLEKGFETAGLGLGLCKTEMDEGEPEVCAPSVHHLFSSGNRRLRPRKYALGSSWGRIWVLSQCPVQKTGHRDADWKCWDSCEPKCRPS